MASDRTGPRHRARHRLPDDAPARHHSGRAPRPPGVLLAGAAGTALLVAALVQADVVAPGVVEPASAAAARLAPSTWETVDRPPAPAPVTGIEVARPPSGTAAREAARTPAGTPAGEAVAAPSDATAPGQGTAPGCVPAPLAERAAAVLVVGLPDVTRPGEPLAREVVRLGVGGVFLSSGNVRTAEQTTALVTGLQEAVLEAHGRPLVVATDEESGRVALARQVVGAGPSPRRLAETRTPQEVEEFAREAGGRLAELGITVDLAPVADLDDGPSDGVIGDRAFGGDADTVTRYASAYWHGLAAGGVLPTAKHFPGHGRSATDTHAEGDVVEASLGELLRTDLVPFAAAVEDGVPVVMLNHLGYRALDPHLPASLSPAAYAALREMGFEGVAMTDSLGMGAVHQRWDFTESVVLAVGAGADAALVTDGSQARAMRDALVAAVRTGDLPEARLSEAAARVTALAGGDPVAMSCLDVELPRLRGSGADETPAAADPGADDDPAAREPEPPGPAPSPTP